MNDNSVFSLPLPGVAILLFVVFLLSILDDAAYSGAQVAGLGPAGVGQRRIVGCGRGEMPLFVGLVKSSAMSFGVSSKNEVKGT